MTFLPKRLTLPCFGRILAADDVEQRCLAGTVRPQQHAPFTHRKLDRDVCDGPYAAEVDRRMAHRERIHRLTPRFALLAA